MSVLITMPSPAGIAQDAMGLGDFSISTRHMRQLPAIARRWWKQNTGISRPAASQACKHRGAGRDLDLEAVDGQFGH